MSQLINVGVVGAGGRVGGELLALISKSEEFSPTYGIGYQAEGFQNNVESFQKVTKGSVDIFIDFSSPALFELALQYCLEHKIPLVSGTTGLLPAHHEQIKKAGEQIPVLWAPNMSLGVAVLKNALKVFKATRHFDFQVEEWHHRHKKDSPSGTALFLQSELERVIEKACPPAMVMRAGGIYGVHKIYAASEEEIIQFEHTAINRTVFARGALVAAHWLLRQKKGSYTMDDVIS
jgi:4-hydroxy-tetrahydrodipicolinate reductase